MGIIYMQLCIVYFTKLIIGLGVKGSTNTHPCLLSPAKKTALLHKWFPDDKAPEQQIGFVLIQFKLGE